MYTNEEKLFNKLYRQAAYDNYNGCIPLLSPARRILMVLIRLNSLCKNSFLSKMGLTALLLYGTEQIWTNRNGMGAGFIHDHTETPRATNSRLAKINKLHNFILAVPLLRPSDRLHIYAFTLTTRGTNKRFDFNETPTLVKTWPGAKLWNWQHRMTNVFCKIWAFVDLQPHFMQPFSHFICRTTVQHLNRFRVHSFRNLRFKWIL